ncbi:retrovirus-related pol polyprotein from transposon TNT 1-94, partial [Tanacetum coccineum]
MAARDSDDALLRSSKVHLANEKTLDIAGVGDVILKTSFSTSWTLKDVRYIPGLKRRLISVGKLDEEGYHVGFEDRQWKVTKSSFVVARENKHGSLYMVQDWWFGKVEEYFLHNVKEDKDTAETAIGVAVENGIVMLKMVLETPLQFSVAERLSRTFRAEHGASCKGFEDVMGRFNSIVAEHGLSSEITQNPGESSDKSEGSENSRSFKDSGRSDKEYSEDGASYKEGGSKTPQVQRSTRESRAPVGYSPLANYLLLTENEPDMFLSQNISRKEGIIKIVDVQASEDVPLEQLDVKTTFLHGDLDEDIYMIQHEGFQLVGQKENLVYSWNEEPCRDVHQVGDEREVKVLRSFNWPPSELITHDGLLPEREMAQPQVNPDSMIAQFSTDRAVWHDRAVLHEPEQFSSKLNNIYL